MQSIGRQQQLHDAVVGRRAGRLNNKDIFSPHVFVQLDGHFAITEFTDAGMAKWHSDVSGDGACEFRVRVTGKNHQVGCHDIVLSVECCCAYFWLIDKGVRVMSLLQPDFPFGLDSQQQKLP